MMPAEIGGLWLEYMTYPVSLALTTVTKLNWDRSGDKTAIAVAPSFCLDPLAYTSDPLGSRNGRRPSCGDVRPTGRPSVDAIRPTDC